MSGQIIVVVRPRYEAKIMVVEQECPLVLRYATWWERCRFWYERRRAAAATIKAAKQEASVTLSRMKAAQRA